jgi:hypothetical protein
MDSITKNGMIITVTDKTIRINEIQDVLDVMVTARYTEHKKPEGLYIRMQSGQPHLF